jgi:hypothetical protein
LGGTKPRPFSALTANRISAFLNGGGPGARFRRRGNRCYVLLDEIPQGCRE